MTAAKLGFGSINFMATITRLIMFKDLRLGRSSWFNHTTCENLVASWKKNYNIRNFSFSQELGGMMEHRNSLTRSTLLDSRLPRLDRWAGQAIHIVPKLGKLAV
jgi:hypothetical protein